MNCFTPTTYLGVLQPHFQPLHGQQPHFLVAAGGCEQPQEVPGHVVDGLAPVQLVTEHVQDILFHALCEFIVPWHELPLLLRAQLLLGDQQLRLTVLLFCE